MKNAIYSRTRAAATLSVLRLAAALMAARVPDAQTITVYSEPKGFFETDLTYLDSGGVHYSLWA